MKRFTHNLPFSVPGVMAAASIFGANPMYGYIYEQTLIIIEEQVRLAAIRLNELLQETYVRDMSNIEEFNRSPRYIEVMRNALSEDDHIGVIWNRDGTVDAKFVDTDRLGNIPELREVQQAAYPRRGTLVQWARMYDAWASGAQNGIGETIERRIDIMLSWRIAPFWELIEIGNQHLGAYPEYGGMGTLKGFEPYYRQEMRRAYSECVRLVVLMVQTQNLTFPDLEVATIQSNQKTLVGYTWTSEAGNTVFARAGTEAIIGGRFRAELFILSKSGDIIKKIGSGWLPSIARALYR